ncbi:MoaD/ThiS family protein [Clostridium magnum]|uniref:ThiS family protein n=1 Tax=Clostridium magnum DSM 2767 TaxID=1121326 RepID=A0A161YJQ1_9CLOT|nr:MoaD/ThiS family protein [Clostridium magnum]KZL90702.1 ThiS family protein [Clostridium magnum DSM 2767]SHI40910.1 Molybdopterin converting factor, small subunit [Clostridium magnum DSM 2767]
MKLEVRLFATFRDRREKKYFLDFNEDTTPRDVVKMLKIDEEEVAILLINGRDGKLNTVLKDNDVLSLFPPVGGG